MIKLMYQYKHKNKQFKTNNLKLIKFNIMMTIKENQFN